MLLEISWIIYFVQILSLQVGHTICADDGEDSWTWKCQRIAYSDLMFYSDALERFANSHKSRAIVDEEATIVKEMKHAMSVMTDETDHEQGIEPTVKFDQKSSDSSTSNDAVDDTEKENEATKEIVDVESTQPIEGTITVESGDYIPTNVNSVKASAEMTRNTSETPSSEINLQFPPSQAKRPRREDDQYIRSAGADVLLPLLIFTVVKSNPQKFVSNLKFIQRYRMPSRLTGEASYCLTNMVNDISL